MLRYLKALPDDHTDAQEAGHMRDRSRLPALLRYLCETALAPLSPTTVPLLLMPPTYQPPFHKSSGAILRTTPVYDHRPRPGGLLEILLRGAPGGYYPS
jgi:hypothetical protein